MNSEKIIDWGNQTAGLWKLVGKAIALHPELIRKLLAKYGVRSNNNNSKAIVDGVLYILGQKNEKFQKEFSDLLNRIDSNDQFIGAIAGAVGKVASAFGGRAQKKAAQAQASGMKAEAKAQTLSSILAYKAQQEQNQAQLQAQQLKVQQEQSSQKQKQKAQTQTLVIIAGIAVALIVVLIFVFQRNQAAPSNVPVPKVITK